MTESELGEFYHRYMLIDRDRNLHDSADVRRRLTA